MFVKETIEAPDGTLKETPSLRDQIVTDSHAIMGGAISATAMTAVLQSLLFEITPLDTATFVAAPTVVALTALLAAWIPARRAARIDPAALLRAEWSPFSLSPFPSPLPFALCPLP